MTQQSISNGCFRVYCQKPTVYLTEVSIGLCNWSHEAITSTSSANTLDFLIGPALVRHFDIRAQGIITPTSVPETEWPGMKTIASPHCNGSIWKYRAVHNSYIEGDVGYRFYIVLGLGVQILVYLYISKPIIHLRAYNSLHGSDRTRRLISLIEIEAHNPSYKYICR